MDEPAPVFGRSMLEHWLLDPNGTYLNHGTVGATPKRVLATQQALRDEMERQPSRFMLRELNLEHPAPWRRVSRLREAMEPVARFLGAQPQDMVFVPSVTTGMNAVLQSVALREGDEVLFTDVAYGAIVKAATAVTRTSGARLVTVHVPFPAHDPSEAVNAIVAGITDRTRLVVIDHVAAQTALIMPVAAIAAACHERGVPVLVDGAHAPGALHLDIASLGVDWYSANLHKWAHAPRACGILWAAPDRQSILHAPIVSWGFEKGFLGEFEHVPTADPTPYLAAPDGIALLQEWGFGRVVRYMHSLAWDAGALLADAWKTTIGAPREMAGAMVTVPLPASAGATVEDAERLRLNLLTEDAIEAPILALGGRLWVRVSVQVYNERADVVKLADAVRRRTPRS